jgi:2-dehydro-3-deoxygluconokinase
VELVSTAPDVPCFSECKLELSRIGRAGNSWTLGVAGDSYNIAVNMKRLGSDVGYMTALGAEDFSDDMLAAWQGERGFTGFTFCAQY